MGAIWPMSLGSYHREGWPVVSSLCFNRTFCLLQRRILRCSWVIRLFWAGSTSGIFASLWSDRCWTISVSLSWNFDLYGLLHSRCWFLYCLRRFIASSRWAALCIYRHLRKSQYRPLIYFLQSSGIDWWILDIFEMDLNQKSKSEIAAWRSIILASTVYTKDKTWGTVILLYSPISSTC